MEVADIQRSNEEYCNLRHTQQEQQKHAGRRYRLEQIVAELKELSNRSLRISSHSNPA
jgi:hypothetical protein